MKVKKGTFGLQTFLFVSIVKATTHELIGIPNSRLDDDKTRN